MNAHSDVLIRPEPRYSWPARHLHWITAGIVLLLVIPMGVWLAYFRPADEALKLRLYNLHESFGILVFVLALIRLAYRGLRPAPPWPSDTPVSIRRMARISHALLYLLLILMPITGFLATNAWGFPLAIFNVLPLPSPIGKDEALAKVLSTLHWTGAALMGSLIALHFAGAVYHRFIKRDRLARRMF